MLVDRQTIQVSNYILCCMHVVTGTTVVIATCSFVLGHFVEPFVPRYGQYVTEEVHGPRKLEGSGPRHHLEY